MAALNLGPSACDGRRNTLLYSFRRLVALLNSIIASKGIIGFTVGTPNGRTESRSAKSYKLWNTLPAPFPAFDSNGSTAQNLSAAWDGKTRCHTPFRPYIPSIRHTPYKMPRISYAIHDTLYEIRLPYFVFPRRATYLFNPEIRGRAQVQDLYWKVYVKFRLTKEFFPYLSELFNFVRYLWFGKWWFDEDQCLMQL